MKFFLITISILACLFNGCRNTDKAENLGADYLGQTPPGNTAQRFAPGIVADIHHEHSRLTVSNDGLELYWNFIPVDTNYRSQTGRPFVVDKANIWFVRKTENGWTEPAVFPLTKNYIGSCPTFSPAGDIFYYKIVDPNADSDVRPKPSILYAAKKLHGEWANSLPVNNILPREKNRASASFCFAENGNLYFDYGGPKEDGEWWWNMYFREYKNGEYLRPVKLEYGINNGRVDWCPWIAPDESYLIWSSHRDGCYGSGDLYISFRNEDGSWGKPTNMGQKVNTEKQERFPSVSLDGKYLFFTRHMPGTYSDIFWISANIIKSIK